MTSHQVCKSSHLAHIWHHTQSTSHHIHTIWHQWSCFMTSHKQNSWPHISSLRHRIHSLGYHTTLCITSSPLYLTSRPLYLGNHTHPIDDITATTLKVLHPVYLWHHIPYVLTKYPLSMTSHHSVVMSPHSAYVWHPLHCRWHRIHAITPNKHIYDTTSTSGMTSRPLYQTFQPLYLFHHNLSTDITPTVEWHHSHLLCDIIWTIYNITSNCYVITLLYLWHHNLYIWNHIQYVWQHIHYTWDITARICVLTPTL